MKIIREDLEIKNLYEVLSLIIILKGQKKYVIDSRESDHVKLKMANLIKTIEVMEIFYSLI